MKDVVSKENNKIVNEGLFIIGLICFLISKFIDITMLRDEKYMYIIICALKYIGLISALIKIVLEKYSYKEYMYIVGAGAVLLITTFYTKNKFLLEYFIIIISCKNIEFKKIVKIFFWVDLFLLLLTMFEAKVGLIENFIGYRAGNKIRQSYGIIYPTDFASQVFFIILAYMYIRDKKISIMELACVFFIGIFIYIKCDARLDTISILLSIVLMGAYKYNLIPFNIAFLNKLVKISFIIFQILMIFLTINYNKNNRIYEKMDTLLSERLSLAHDSYKQNGFKLFGQEMEYFGRGADGIPKGEKMNYLDSTFVRIFIEYGLLFMIFLAYIFYATINRSFEIKQYLLILMILLLFVNCTIAQHFFDFSYNFIILMFFASFNGESFIKDNKGQLYNTDLK